MSNKDSSLSKVVLGILSLVNIILILGAGFAGESGVKIFGQSFPLKTSIIVLVLGILTNFFATLKDRKMLYLGGVILAAFVLLFTLISIGEERALPMWLLFSSLIYLSGLLGGIAAVLAKKYILIKPKNDSSKI